MAIQDEPGTVRWRVRFTAAVDHGVDLRNHDPERTWLHDYAEI